jgi:hypothetical protein
MHWTYAGRKKEKIYPNKQGISSCFLTNKLSHFLSAMEVQSTSAFRTRLFEESDFQYQSFNVKYYLEEWRQKSTWNVFIDILLKDTQAKGRKL